jgi:hypothetical protein
MPFSVLKLQLYPGVSCKRESVTIKSTAHLISAGLSKSYYDESGGDSAPLMALIHNSAPKPRWPAMWCWNLRLLR